MPRGGSIGTTRRGKDAPVERILAGVQLEFLNALKELYGLFGSLTMASVARRVGVSESSVSHWLSGRRTPDEEALGRLYVEASKAAPGTGRNVPWELDHLLDLRRRSRCGVSGCPDRRAATVLASHAEGDRRNVDRGPECESGDRRNELEPVAVGKPLPTDSEAVDILLLWKSEKRNEAFRLLCRMADRLSVMEFCSVAVFLVDQNCGGAARALLERAAVQRTADMVDIALAAFEARS